ncbi:MAG: D-alanyl-D-alanine carboxypeptidase/D-alanyl-D-alanine-endopeptidase [Polyangiaceae bacterium]|nr:D-alanyl-D-alanine carboxypeptidase/D-alanyl-D-alanine-endopeptidase [Polyangiaceae bacterium]
MVALIVLASCGAELTRIHAAPAPTARTATAPKPVAAQRRPAAAPNAGSAASSPSETPDPGEQSDLGRAVARCEQWVRGRGGRASIAVVDVGSGRILAAAEKDQALNPASNAKLLTTVVALDKLGPGYRFTTGLYGELNEGSVDALVLRGDGDPSLRSEDLGELAEKLVLLGVEQVGKLWVDQSRFDEQFVPPAFEQQPQEWAAFRAPVSAVAVERNAISMHVLPRRPGQPARVWFHPPALVQSLGEVKTTPRGTGQKLTLSVSARGSSMLARVGGRIAEGLPEQRFTRRVEDPRLLPGLVLRYELKIRGVKVNEQPELGGDGITRALALHRSAPLGILSYELGKNSDNFTAEMLLKTLGGKFKGTPARSADGAAVISDWLRQHGLLTPSTRITNGSGLFDANRISALALARLLALAYKEPRIAPEFLAELAVGGVDGTLQSRFQGAAVRGRIRAKTGTLATTDALSGYVMAPGGRMPIAVSILVNGIAEHRAVREHVDQVVQAVAAGLWQGPGP